MRDWLIHRLKRLLNRQLLSALGPAIVSLIMISVAESYLPNSGVKFRVKDALLLPGALLAAVFLHGGVHEGPILVFIGLMAVFNCVIYTLFWYCVMRVVAHLRSRGNNSHTV